MKEKLFVLFLLFIIRTTCLGQIITITNVTNSSAEIECKNYFSEQYSDYELIVKSTNDYHKQNYSFNITGVRSVTLDNLTAGVFYSVQLFGISDKYFEELIDQTHLTTKPNTPKSLNILMLGEDSIIIKWTPPDSVTEQNSYLIGLANDSQNISEYFEIKNVSQPPRTNITGLTPGKTYLLVIVTYLTHQNQTISTSEPIYMRFRTRPHPPIDLKVDQNSMSSHSFTIRWEPPKVVSEIDSFSISYKFKDKTYYKRVDKNDNHFVLISKSINPGITYKLKVISMSTDTQARISSESLPIYFNITTPPLPVTNIRTTSTDNSEIFIEWSDNHFSSQDSYEVSVRELMSKNNSFHRINKRSLLISNLTPGHNYSISVTALSNGVSSNITTVYHAVPVQRIKLTTIILILSLICLLSFILTGTYSYLNNKKAAQDKAPGTSQTIPNEYIELPQLFTIDDNIRIDRNDLEFNESNLIGSGHYGEVYNGYLMMKNAKLVIREPVAIKISSLETDMNSFLKEALIMKNFEHKNVLSLIGVSLEDGSPIVVLPFMQNKDLLSYIRNESNAPTVKQLINFAIDVSNGMEYLSSLHIIHRDLAARNCMVDKDLTIKVADFGLSRHSISRDEDKSDTYMSENFNQLLPIKWMSIESIEERIYTQKTDVWSFGVLVWEVLTRGETPYHTINNRVLLMHLKQGQRLPQPLYCPNDIYNTLLNSWDSCPENRPTFTQLSANLSEIIEKLENNFKQKQMKRNECNIYYDFSK